MKDKTCIATKCEKRKGEGVMCYDDDCKDRISLHETTCLNVECPGRNQTTTKKVTQTANVIEVSFGIVIVLIILKVLNII